MRAWALALAWSSTVLLAGLLLGRQLWATAPAHAPTLSVTHPIVAFVPFVEVDPAGYLWCWTPVGHLVSLPPFVIADRPVPAPASLPPSGVILPSTSANPAGGH